MRSLPRRSPCTVRPRWWWRPGLTVDGWIPGRPLDARDPDSPMSTPSATSANVATAKAGVQPKASARGSRSSDSTRSPAAANRPEATGGERRATWSSATTSSVGCRSTSSRVPRLPAGFMSRPRRLTAEKAEFGASRRRRWFATPTRRAAPDPASLLPRAGRLSPPAPRGDRCEAIRGTSGSINAPEDKVYAYVSDFTRHGEWGGHGLAVHRGGDRSRWRSARRSRPRPAARSAPRRNTARLTDMMPNTSFAWELEGD